LHCRPEYMNTDTLVAYPSLDTTMGTANVCRGTMQSFYDGERQR
jgi:hypothetical protein